MWATLEKEEILDTPHLRIVRERVENHNGQIIEDYYVASKGDVAMVLAITENGDVLLIREYRHGCKDYVWQLPAGQIDEGETPLEGAKRELLQETGYEASGWELLASWYISSPRMPDKQFIFVARGAHQVRPSQPEETEEIILKVTPWEEAVRMVLAGEVKDPHSCTAILWVDRGEK